MLRLAALNASLVDDDGSRSVGGGVSLPGRGPDGWLESGEKRSIAAGVSGGGLAASGLGSGSRLGSGGLISTIVGFLSLYQSPSLTFLTTSFLGSVILSFKACLLSLAGDSCGSVFALSRSFVSKA